MYLGIKGFTASKYTNATLPNICAIRETRRPPKVLGQANMKLRSPPRTIDLTLFSPYLDNRPAVIPLPTSGIPKRKSAAHHPLRDGLHFRQVRQRPAKLHGSRNFFSNSTKIQVQLTKYKMSRQTEINIDPSNE